jgi:hypothetical protein
VTRPFGLILRLFHRFEPLLGGLCCGFASGELLYFSSRFFLRLKNPPLTLFFFSL